MFKSRQIFKREIMTGWVCLLILIIFLFLNGCANRLPEPCVKEGRVYCVTDEWIFSENWYSCYLRGISCTQGGCWQNARDEFLRAVQKRDQDARWVRTYGMHRLPEYFPNRELGVAYYHLDDLDNALGYLTTSLEQCESAKAKHYLNKVRRDKLLLTREDIASPQIFIDSYPKAIAIPKISLSGLARDDTFVANILIQVNREAFIPLMELSQPQSKAFHRHISLRPGINDVLIRVVDLLEKAQDERIKILVDQEGPMIFFAAPPEADLMSVQGIVYDPSDIAWFSLNGREVALSRIEDDSKEELNPAYSFHFDLSIQEWQEGILYYQAEDFLQNTTTGTLRLFDWNTCGIDLQACSFQDEPIRIALASQISAVDCGTTPILHKVANQRDSDPIQIKISQFPRETFAEEICPQIEILARVRIKEIAINGEPILSIYGLRWSRFFDWVFKEYLDRKGEGRFLFNRLIKLKEGENNIHFKVVDFSGHIWEEWIQIRKKTKRIHQLEERWRMAIPFIIQSHPKNDQGFKKRDLTYQLIEAFINQGRFRVIDIENLPIIIDEKRLSYYLGHPNLGLSSDSRIWVDTFLLGYFQETEDSFTLSASMVDLETGEILATKDVCEEIDTSLLAWQEEDRMHILQTCCVLAAKFQEHFPLCEGEVISLMDRDLKTGICKNDGLKKGMKLLLYTGNLDHEEDYVLLGDAKVKEVKKEYSMASLLEDLSHEAMNDDPMKWWVITR